ncbi:transposase [Streptomyces coeruleorubidus]
MNVRPWIVDDDLWALIEPLLPPWPEKAPGPRPVDGRLCLQGLLRVLCNDVSWQLLPLEMGFGSGQTCWRRLGRWHEAGANRPPLQGDNGPAGCAMSPASAMNTLSWRGQVPPSLRARFVVARQPFCRAAFDQWVSVRFSRRVPWRRVIDIRSLGASSSRRCQRPRGTITAAPACSCTMSSVPPRRVGTEVEADAAGQAAHGFLSLWVHLPVVGVNVGVGLHVERGDLPGAGAAVRHLPFDGSDVAVGVEMQRRGEQVDGGGRHDGVPSSWFSARSVDRGTRVTARRRGSTPMATTAASTKMAAAMARPRA